MTEDKPFDETSEMFDELSTEQVETILHQLEQKNLVFKTWDIKRQDYVWHYTESGREFAEKLNL